MTKIKICGLVREQDIAAVNMVHPDYIGFVFAESKRRIDADRARELKTLLAPGIEAVGVFVNEKIEKVKELCSSGVIDLIQLHGDEDEDYIKELRNSISSKIIKAVRVRDTESIIKAAQTSADFILLDAYREGRYGGVGMSFDWSLIPELDKPFFLAGGICPDNVEMAIGLHSPYCIDVSSGVETDGYKDPKKISAIVAKVREG